MSRSRLISHLRNTSIALSIALAAPHAIAQMAMTQNEYKTQRAELAAKHKGQRAQCASLSGNANDICLAEVEGSEKVEQAELEARYKPTIENQYEIAIARAEAAFKVASERCDDKDGNPKDVCLKEAKANEVAAKADAKAKQSAAEANSAASEQALEARKDAMDEKRDADFAVAREKCDAYADEAKEKCIDAAEEKYGKR